MKKKIKKSCTRCKADFYFNPLIQGDDVCGTCERMNCISFWYPKLFRLNFPMPKTVILHTNLPLEDLADDLIPKRLHNFLMQMKEAIAEVGAPAFLRTGYLSYKHHWKDSCYISKETIIGDGWENRLTNHIRNLVEMSAVATI